MAAEARVLIVDGDVTFAKALAHFLKQQEERWEVAWVTTLEEGLRAALTNVYQVVVVDNDLEDKLTWLDFVREIRVAGARVALVVVTSKFESLVDAEEAIIAGADDHVPKISGPEEIHRRLAFRFALAARCSNGSPRSNAQQIADTHPRLFGNSGWQQIVAHR